MADKIILNAGKKKEIVSYVNRLRQDGLTIEKIIIFGSHARNKAKPWSDIDLCIVSRKFGADRFAERIWLMKRRNLDTADIEPHPYNPKDLADKWDPLAEEIKKYGIEWQEVAP
jgi:predicted nucleotidyltransferase